MDEARIIAWIDGELDGEAAAEVAAAVAADPALAAQAEVHRRLKARFAAAFDPIATVPAPAPRSERPAAPVVSLAAVRAARVAETPKRKSWAVPGAIAASLLIGVLVGHQWLPGGGGIADRAGTLALSPSISHALDGQLAGEVGAVRVAVSFRDHQGDYCRSFAGEHLAGVACRAGSGWQLRYAAPGLPQRAEYRMAGADGGTAEAIAAMIEGDPLDAAQERDARNAGWRPRKS